MLENERDDVVVRVIHDDPVNSAIRPQVQISVAVLGVGRACHSESSHHLLRVRVSQQEALVVKYAVFYAVIVDKAIVPLDRRPRCFCLL
jgi:hypothetical protein